MEFINKYVYGNIPVLCVERRLFFQLFIQWENWWIIYFQQIKGCYQKEKKWTHNARYVTKK